MGISERRETEKEALKQKIFDGASKLIIEHGYEKLSIRKLAEKIEYSPAVIYNYFENKDDIIRAITIDNYEKILGRLLSIDFDSMIPETALKTGLSTFAHLLLNRREQLRATILSGIGTYDEMSDDNEAMNLLAAILVNGVSQGVFEIDNIKFTAFLLSTGVFGMVSMIVLNKIYDENMINITINSYIKLLVKGVIK